jgi:DNA-binding response OmpR family regulator
MHAATPNERPARILIVDDEPAAATTAQPGYALVVTNNCTPHLSGAEMVAALRERFPDIPILHLDDLSRPHDAALPANVPNLYKPFSIDRLLEEVGALLGRTQGS